MAREGGYDEMTIADGLRKLEAGLAMACSDSAADLVRRAREEIERLRAVLIDARPFVEHEVEQVGAKPDCDLLQAIDELLQLRQSGNKEG